MPTISLVTAVAAEMDEHILETYESLAAQRLPEHWQWEWLVQEDGQTGGPAKRLPSDSRISAGTGRKGRAPMARTVALERATGEFVRALDADDLFPDEDTLAQDITTLMDHPGIAWCVSGSIDFYPDGSTKPGPHDPPPGPLAPGAIAEGLRAGKLPVVGTTLCTYTELVIALGGWQAIPGSEDVALTLAAEAVSDGWMNEKPGLLYRRWASSSTADPAHAEGLERTTRRTVALARSDALRALGWRWTPPPIVESRSK